MFFWFFQYFTFVLLRYPFTISLHLNLKLTILIRRCGFFSIFSFIFYFVFSWNVLNSKCLTSLCIWYPLQLLLHYLFELGYREFHTTSRFQIRCVQLLQLYLISLSVFICIVPSESCILLCHIYNTDVGLFFIGTFPFQSHLFFGEFVSYNIYRRHLLPCNQNLADWEVWISLISLESFIIVYCYCPWSDF